MTFVFLLNPLVIALVYGPLAVACIVLAVRRPVRRISWLRRLALVVALALVAATPAFEAAEQPSKVTNVEAYFVVDKTGSMAAYDYIGNKPRLAGVKADLKALVAQLAGSRFSIIGWDSIATRALPLTTDARAVISWADTLQQENTYLSHGSDLALPFTQLKKALERSSRSNPQNIRLVFFLSDGEVRSAAESGAGKYAALAHLIDGGFVLGYGTPNGAPMTLNDGLNPITPGKWIIDPASGKPAISHLDAQNLQAVARALGIGYQLRTAPDDGAALVSAAGVQTMLAEGKSPVKLYRHFVWPVGIVIALLLAWEVWQMPRRHRRRGTIASRLSSQAAR